jgi:hypothetical protein
MYDFVLGTEEQVYANEKSFLLAVKRMLPRWLNSIPDSEYGAICTIAQESCKGYDAPVIVETGVGASTLALVWFAAKYGGHVYTWDISSAKAAVIRQVCNEALGPYIGDVRRHWTLVPWMSTSSYLGISNLAELDKRVCLSFHDSDHTWSNVEAELRAVSPLMLDGGVIALDDANLRWLDTNIGLVNTYRRKLGWPGLDAKLTAAQTGEIHWLRALDLLRNSFEDVTHLEDEYKLGFAEDPYFAWFDTEFQIKTELGTEQQEALMHRFDAFRVHGFKE